MTIFVAVPPLTGGLHCGDGDPQQSATEIAIVRC